MYRLPGSVSCECERITKLVKERDENIERRGRLKAAVGE
jgi:hypothetical protein